MINGLIQSKYIYKWIIYNSCKQIGCIFDSDLFRNHLVTVMTATSLAKEMARPGAKQRLAITPLFFVSKNAKKSTNLMIFSKMLQKKKNFWFCCCLQFRWKCTLLNETQECDKWVPKRLTKRMYNYVFTLFYQ